MASSSTDIHSRKGKKKSGSPKQAVVPVNKKTTTAVVPKDNAPLKAPINMVKDRQRSTGLFDKKPKNKKKKSLARTFVSLSIVAYLGYYSLYACGSPYDTKSDKPAVCSAIDPIKLDVISLFESNYYKKNIDPYVSPAVNKANEVYHDYGLPLQIKANNFYWKHGKPGLDNAYIQANNLVINHGIPIYQKKIAPIYKNNVVPIYQKNILPVYQKKVLPIYQKNVAPVINPYIKQAQPYLNQAKPYINGVKPYINQAKPYIYGVRNIDINQIKPLYENGVKTMNLRANEAQVLLQDKFNQLPPSVHHYKDIVLHWIDRAENTDLVPILIKFYWNIIDFYQSEFLPLFHSNPSVNQLKLYYNQNAKAYVDQHIKPFLLQVNQHIHVDQLLAHILSLLPTRLAETTEQVFAAKTSSTQVKTSTVVPKTQHVPITPPAASIKTVTVKDTPAPVPATSVVPTHTDETTVKSTHTTQSTIAVSVGSNKNSDHVTRVKSSVKPSFTPKPDPEAAPDAEKKEAIYCPTCNAQEEQLIVANTDKNVIPVRTDKHVIPVPTDNEVFEVNKQDIDIPVQPTTPSEEKFVDDQQIVIQAPIPSKKEETSTIPSKKEETTIPSVVKEEDIVFSIQTEVPTQSEEDIIFSIQTEAPTQSEEDNILSIQTQAPTQSEEDIVFSIQTEPAALDDETIVLNVEDKLEKEKVEEVDQKIVEEIKHEARKEEMNKKDHIFVPPAVEKEELVLESAKENEKRQIKEDEPVFIKVDEPQVEQVDLKEPVVKVVEEPVHTEEPIAIVQADPPVVKSTEPHPPIKINAPNQHIVPVEQ